MDDDFYYFVRPFYNLGNICELMTESKINLLTERELSVGARTLFKALLTIHKSGFLHGDVRP